MEVKETGIEGLIEFIPRIFSDERGWFVETYKQTFFDKYLPNITFSQDNQSFSVAGVLRGLHLQKGKHAQGKLVRVVTGKALDVVVDLRKESKTYGQWYSVLLEADKQNLLYVPEGFAHGFYALEDTVFSYKCTNEYNKEAEGGIIWNDADLNIDWQLKGEPNVSPKDLELPTLKELGDIE